ncbi:MAG: cupin domain-containing protein [Vicinamibacterales bacterium]
MAGDFDEHVALDVLGLLSEAERDALHHEVESQPGRDAAALYECGAVLADVFPPVTPPAHIRQAILTKVSAPREKPFVSPQLSFLMHDEGWRPHPLITGIRFKQLALDEARGVATLLLKVEPGTVYPSHHHSGHEECYVIDGDLHVAGRHLGPGDFHHADGGSDHGTLTTTGGCTVLLVVDARDYLGS